MKVFVNPWTLVEVDNLFIDALDAFNPALMLKQNVNRGNNYPDIIKESADSLFVGRRFLSIIL